MMVDVTELAGSGASWLESLLGGPKVSRGAGQVIRTLDGQPRLASYASAAQIADLSGVNVSTVVRTAQLLGFSGWPALRRELRSRYLASLSATEVLNEHEPRTTHLAGEAARADIGNLQELQRSLDRDQMVAVARLLTGSRRTLVLGSGSFAAPGLQLSHLGQTMGYDIRLHREGGTALLNAVTMLGPQDCLVLYRLWRSPSELMDAVRVARQQDCRVVCVTDRLGQELSELSTELVVVPSEGVSFFPSLAAAMTLTHAVLAEMVGQDEEFARRSSDRAEALWDAHGLFDTPGPRAPRGG